ncbi:MAG TPA: glycosyltransferase [Thermoanaerobaculia bacterium]|nr:glycosyltransferase [Thermoanaerobaculia bacterium]
MDTPVPEARGGGAIRLLWLIDSLTAGGAEALTVPFARALHREDRGEAAGVRLEIAFLKSLGGNPFEAELRDLEVPVTGLGARNLRDVAAFRRLVRLLRQRRVGLVHAHLAYASIWGLLAGRLTGTPVVLTLHVRPPDDPPWSREGLRRRLLVGAANRWARRALAVSGAVRDAWAAVGLRRERIAVVHNGVETAGMESGTEAAAAVRRELGVPGGAPLVVTVSVLRPGKGLEVLLEAVPAVLGEHPDARFAVVGDGPERRRLEEGAAAAGLGEAVVFTGFRRDVPALLAAADLFVLPTRDDAFPTVLLEAQAAGVAVVASRAGGVPEIVEDGATGVLVPPGDPAALARAVSALLADPAARRRLAEAGRRRTEERFSADAWLARLDAVYSQVLGRPVRLGRRGAGEGAA